MGSSVGHDLQKKLDEGKAERKTQNGWPPLSPSPTPKSSQRGVRFHRSLGRCILYSFASQPHDIREYPVACIPMLRGKDFESPTFLGSLFLYGVLDQIHTQKSIIFSRNAGDFLRPHYKCWMGKKKITI